MRPTEQKPSIGRIVHDVSYGTPGGEYKSVCRAAMITDGVPDRDVVSLCVINPSGTFFDLAIPYSEEHKGGTWHWPERV
ncbi:MAG TPA: hypothetical protein VFA10_27040 [Ktedonobacteraceae bacterium]|nr:hypothetical protein [Ktedonobacteraceae bacterium]